MKSILILAMSVTLVACTPTYESANATFPALPRELEDCKFFKVTGTSGQTLNVVRCPNSTVSTKTEAKNPVRVIIVDGVEYQQKETK